MVLQNEFLVYLAGQAHERVVEGCFCDECRNSRLRRVLDSGYTVHQLYNLFTYRLVEKENTRLDRLFKCTLQQIVHGMAYKITCLQNSNYTYFKSWAKTQQEFALLSKKELDKFCYKVNEACDVFNSWTKIVDNLTDERLDQIDARRFSIRQFYLAKNITWCLEYNESLRIKGMTKTDLPYPEDKYNDILQYIIASGILDDVDNNPQIAASIGGRIQSDIVRRANTRYRPY